jgi:hypothetical protein
MKHRHKKSELLPEGSVAYSKLTGWECVILKHVARFEDGWAYKVRWTCNGHEGEARVGHLVVREDAR